MTDGRSPREWTRAIFARANARVEDPAEPAARTTLPGHVPGEGSNPQPPPANPGLGWVRELFARANDN